MEGKSSKQGNPKKNEVEKLFTSEGKINQEELVNKNITDIIIHHTANESESLEAIDNAHKKRKTTASGEVLNQSKSGKYQNIDYHYIILKDGTIISTRPENQVGRATKEHNGGVIHIALIGNFNDHPPTIEQYQTLGKKVKELQKKYKIQFIGGHRDVGQTACPGKLFDFNMISHEGKPLGTRKITRYYSPVPEQKIWLSYEKGYEDSYNRQFKGDPDITMPADQKRYTDADAKVAVACPGKEWLGKKLYIVGIGSVQCRDTGGSITKHRIDIYMGIGENAVKRFNDIKDGDYKVYEIQ